MPKVHATNKEFHFIAHCMQGTLTQEIIDEAPGLVNLRSVKNYWPLMLTVIHKKISTLELLIKNDAIIDQHINGTTALWFAASLANWDAVDKLLAHGAHVDATPQVENIDAGKTALWLAAEAKNWKVVFELLEKGANIDATPTDAECEDAGKTALWFAAEAKNWKVVFELLEKGANINAFPTCEKDEDANKTILMFAILDDNLEAVVKLLEKGAKDTVFTVSDGRNALLMAAHEEKWEIFSKILEITTAINGADYNGETALTLAAYFKNWDMVIKLVDRGADINAAPIQDKDTGKTAVWYAANEGEWEIVFALLDKGANMEVFPLNKQVADPQATILWMAVEKDNTKAVKELLKRRANVEAKDKKSGTTPLWKAIINKNIELASLLLRYGADIKIKHPNGQTMLWYATSRGLWEISELLLDFVINNEVNDLNYAPIEGEHNNLTVFWFAVLSSKWDVALKLLLKGADPDKKPAGKKYAKADIKKIALKANREDIVAQLTQIAANAPLALAPQWQKLIFDQVGVTTIKVNAVKLLNELFTQYYKAEPAKEEKLKFSLKKGKNCPEDFLAFKKSKDGSFSIRAKELKDLLAQWNINDALDLNQMLSDLIKLSEEYTQFLSQQNLRKQEQEYRQTKAMIDDSRVELNSMLTQTGKDLHCSQNEIDKSYQAAIAEMQAYKLSIIEVIELVQVLDQDAKKFIREKDNIEQNLELLLEEFNYTSTLPMQILEITTALKEKLKSRIEYTDNFSEASLTKQEANVIKSLCDEDLKECAHLKQAASLLKIKFTDKLSSWENMAEDYVKKTEKNKIAIKKFQENIKTNEHHARRLEDIKQEAAQMRLEVERQVQSQNDNLYHNAYKKVTKISNQNAKKEKKIRLQQAPVTKAEDRLSPHMEVLQPAVDNYRPKKRRLTNLNILHDLMQVREKTEVQVNILKEMLSYTPGPERAYIYTRNYSLLVVLASFMESLKQIDTELFAKKLIYDFRNAVYHSSVLNYATDKGQEQFYEELKSLSSKLLAYMDKPGATEYANIATHSLVIKLLDPLKSELSIKEVNSIIHYEVENLELFHESYCCFYKDDTEPTLADRNNFHTIYIKACEYAIARISAGLNWLAYNDITPNRAEYTNQLEKLRAKNSRVKTINNSHKALKVYSKLTGQKINLFLGTNIKQQGNDIRHNNPKRLSPETLPHAESDLSQSVDTTLPISPLNKDNKHSSDIQSPGDSIRILSVTNSSKANTPSPTLCPIKPPPMVTFASFKTCLSEIIVGKVQNIYVNSPSFMIETKSGIRTATLGTSLSYPQVISLTQGIIQSAILNHDDKVNFEINLHLGSYLGELEESAGDEQTKILFSINSYFKSRNIYAYVNLYFESAVCDDSFRPHKLQEILSSSDLPHSKVLASSAPAAIPAKIMLFSAPATAMHTPLSSQLINNPLTPSLDVMPKPVSPQVLQAIKGLQYIFMDGLTNYNERQIQEALDNQLIHIAKHENIVFLICASNSSSSTRVESYNYVINAVNDNYVITSSEYYSTNNDLSQGIMSDEDKIKIHELFSDFWNCEDSIAYNP